MDRVRDSSERVITDAILLGGVYDGLTSFPITVPRPKPQGPHEGSAAYLGGLRQPPKELLRYDLRYARAGTALWLCRNTVPLFETVGSFLANQGIALQLDPLEQVPRIVEFIGGEDIRSSRLNRLSSLAQLMMSAAMSIDSDSPDWHGCLKQMALLQADVPDRSPVSPLIRWSIEIETQEGDFSLGERQASLDEAIAGWDGLCGFDLNRWAYILLTLELHRAATPLAKRAHDCLSGEKYFPAEARTLMTTQDKNYNIVACQDTYGWALCYEGLFNDARSLLSAAADGQRAFDTRGSDWCELQYHRAHLAFWQGNKDESIQIALEMREANPSNEWTKRANRLFSSVGRKLRTPSQRSQSYDVVISFAGEDRDTAGEIAEKLKRRGIIVFYDDFERSALWGKDLSEYLTDIYQNQGRFCLVLVSENYKKKRWTRLEWRAVQARCFVEDREYCLPVRLDDTELPGLLPTAGILSLQDSTVDEIVEAVLQKLRGLAGSAI